MPIVVPVGAINNTFNMILEGNEEVNDANSVAK
jgi:hypothetical protein